MTANIPKNPKESTNMVVVQPANGLPVKNGEIQEIEKNDKILIGKVEVNVV